MSYFAPYIGGSGIHMPTYEDRLEDLVTAYRNIFDVDAELSASVVQWGVIQANWDEIIVVPDTGGENTHWT